jgi:ComF family protein
MTEWRPIDVAPAAISETLPPRAPLSATLRRFTQLAAKTALDLVYPPSCLACRVAVSAPGTLCPECWNKVRFIERPYCERLGTPFAQDLGPGLISPDAMADPPVWNRARAVAVYDEGPGRALAQRLKYYDRMEVARPLGRWMARAGAELLEGADVLVPVPLHRWRLAGRRFNQAMALADVISGECGVPADPMLLERVKPTPPQVGLSKLQRAENMQGAFRAPDEARPRIAGQRIVLVDDVLTSGATTNAAARVLLRAGAASVDVLVFARVVTAA